MIFYYERNDDVLQNIYSVLNFEFYSIQRKLRKFYNIGYCHFNKFSTKTSFYLHSIRILSKKCAIMITIRVITQFSP